MTLTFKYRKETIDGNEYYFPKIPIVLSNKENKIEIAALLDSGATNIFIPKGIADALELEFEKTGKPEQADSWIGKFTIYESSVRITLGKGSQTFRQEMPCSVPIIENENNEIILGRTFFQFFEITFNENKKTTRLKKVE